MHPNLPCEILRVLVVSISSDVLDGDRATLWDFETIFVSYLIFH